MSAEPTRDLESPAELYAVHDIPDAADDDGSAEVIALKTNPAFVAMQINRFLAEADDDDPDHQISRATCRRYKKCTGLSVRTLRRYQRLHRILKGHLKALEVDGADHDALRKATAQEMKVSVMRLMEFEAEGVTARLTRPRTVITREAETLLASLRGNATALAENLRENPEDYGYESCDGLSDSNVRAAVLRDAGRLKREVYRRGAVAGDKHKLRANRRNVAYENPVREFQVDGRKVCEALLDGEMVAVHVISVIDTLSAACVGLHVATTENADAVLLALFDAAVASDRSPLAGLPLGGRLTSDNGSAETACAVKSACLALGIDHHRVDRFEPNQNGSVEAWHGLMKERLDPHLGYRPDAPTDRGAKKPWCDPRAALPFETVRRLVRDFQSRTNFERERAFLDGATSATHFAEHADGVHTLGPDEMIWLLPAVDATVRRYGVRIGDGVAYIHPHMADLEGEAVEVRYIPGDTDAVYICHGGSFICEAVPNISESQAGELSGRGKRLERDAVAVMKEVAAQRRQVAQEEREKEEGLPPSELVAGRDTFGGEMADKSRKSVDGAFEVDPTAQGIAQ